MMRAALECSDRVPRSHTSWCMSTSGPTAPRSASRCLGYVHHPRAVFRVGRDVEVEPDLMVRQPHPDPTGHSETAPLPILVAEVASPSSRRRDYGKKRDLYLDEGIAEYWIVDGDRRTVTSAKSGCDPEIVSDRLTWAPAGASAPLTFEIERVFDVRPRSPAGRGFPA